jgi:hypothetical protein
MTSALEVGGWSAPRPDHFTPGKDPVPIVQEAGWAPGLVWTCAKNLAPTGIRSPNRPACSQSLYRLSYPARSFLLKLDTILQSVYTPMLYFILCGDININNLNESGHKNQLDNLLLSYNLTSIIDFPTRVQNTSATAIDNFLLIYPNMKALWQSQS